MSDKPDLKSMTKSELQTFLSDWNEPNYRAGQLYDWMHKKGVSSFDEMTNLPLSFRSRLKEETELTRLAPVTVQISKEDGTRKYLFALSDGNLIESVLMRYHHGLSVCISSQAGCRMGCRFCASTIDGLARNLTTAEMLEQVYEIEKDCKERISHVVVMGSGEPFDNYDAVVRFLRMISDPDGKQISERNLTLSTCGIVPGILRFADEGLHVTLALSLHAPNDSLRKTIMPVANRYPLPDVLSACDTYFEKTGRRITYEYSLMAGINDRKKDAEELSSLLKGRPCLVNLIPVNPVKERNFTSSKASDIAAFQNILEKNGINVTIRREMGRDINGACGQLRRAFQKSKIEGEES